MGSRRRTTVTAPTAAVVNVGSGSVSTVTNNVTNVSNVTTVVTNNTVIYRNPPPPPPQLVITSSSTLSTPAVTSISSTIVRSSPPDLAPTPIRYASSTNVWSNVPFVSISGGTSPSVTVVNSTSVDVSLRVAEAQNTRADLCDSLTNTSSATQQWTFVGNGSATRFRFTVRGAPTNVVVVNLTSGATVSPSSYSISVRGDSFSWLVFDTAPTDGVSYSVTFDVGDSGTIRTIDAGSWRNWQSLVGELSSKLDSIKTATSTSIHIGANSVTTWNAGDPTLVNDAQNAVNELRKAIKRPGMRMDVGQVAGICDYLNKQLTRIEGNLGKVGVVEGIRCGTNPPKPNTDSNVAGRIYQNDIRYTYFVGPSSCASYRPPNQPDMLGLAVCYSKKYDSATGRFYYSIG
jgi:hypothetical protein